MKKRPVRFLTQEMKSRLGGEPKIIHPEQDDPSWSKAEFAGPQKARALEAFEQARAELNVLFKTDSAILQKGDEGIPIWLASAESVCRWQEQNAVWMLYLTWDEPWIVYLYGYLTSDDRHPLALRHAENEFINAAYSMPIEDKIASLDNPSTTPEVLWVLFEYGRAYPSRQIHDAIARNRLRQFGDHQQEFVDLALKMMNDEIALVGDRFPLTLREVEPSDLDPFYEHQLDPEAIRMAAFVGKDRKDKGVFDAHWAKILKSSQNTNRTIVADGQVAGYIACYPQGDHLEVTYWLGRKFWGRGFASHALRLMLHLVVVRPIFARAATDNLGSIRVLQKCGFKLIGQDKGFAPGRGEETEEYILRLDSDRAKD